MSRTGTGFGAVVEEVLAAESNELSELTVFTMSGGVKPLASAAGKGLGGIVCDLSATGRICTTLAGNSGCVVRLLSVTTTNVKTTAAIRNAANSTTTPFAIEVS
jgi:hypothetical protein